MALSILSNQAATATHQFLTKSSETVTDSLTRLAAGQRTVSARNDAVSLAIGSRLSAEVQSLSVARTNASQANAMLQIADGALQTVGTMLVRMKQLATQGASANLSATERSFVFDEFKSIRSEVNRIAQDTEFNGNRLLAGKTDFLTDKKQFAAGRSAANLNAQNGFASIEFATDTQNIRGGQNFTLAYDDTTSTFTVTNDTTGKSQSIDFTYNKSDDAVGFFKRAISGGPPPNPASLTAQQRTFMQAGLDARAAAYARQPENFDTTAAAIAAERTANAAAIKGATDAAQPFVATPLTGTTRELSFSEFGLTVTLNDAFKGRNISTGNTFQISQSVRDTTLAYRIGTGNRQNEDALSFTLEQANINSLSAKIETVTGFTQIGDAKKALEYVGEAIDTLQSARANVGTAQNRLQFAQQNLTTTKENNEAARANLTDLDMASEMTKLTSRQILLNSGISMLSQAHQVPRNLIKLMKN